jgi:hypothetical protein
MWEPHTRACRQEDCSADGLKEEKMLARLKRIECILWQGEDEITDLDQLESKKATPLQITESVGWAPTSWVGTYRQ